MSQYFFSGGLMPAASTFLHFQQHLQLEQHWQWAGTQYERTANAWLENMDAKQAELKPLFEQTYGHGCRNLVAALADFLYGLC